MKLSHFLIVHPIEVVSCQDEHIIRPHAPDFEQLLADCVCSALVPAIAARGLFGGPNLHPSPMKSVKEVGAVDMAVQGDGVKLGEHRNTVDARVNAIADGDIDQPVFTGDWHGGLGAFEGEWEKAVAAPAAQDDGKDIGC